MYNGETEITIPSWKFTLQYDNSSDNYSEHRDNSCDSCNEYRDNSSDNCDNDNWLSQFSSFCGIWKKLGQYLQ